MAGQGIKGGWNIHFKAVIVCSGTTKAPPPPRFFDAALFVRPSLLLDEIEVEVLQKINILRLTNIVAYF